ncbi:AraC family transcriptional regulator [Chlorobium sp. N1]|uniref:AraC family transcriptional regulator n=1 Tax=Chlorobium sp. N1 TaxID=2491138 RepID=UPI00103E71BB|nr:AraC family transcriptional regulator [Chlorobium sp. N1]TCD48087.1 AraC family transcriptional regulator [Chlorobium sp. N1]
MLRLISTWNADGHCFVRWRYPSMVRLQQLKPRLQGELRQRLSNSCMHVKGYGGAKRCVGIALKYGYTHVNQFTTAFRKQFGYTPGSIRQ